MGSDLARRVATQNGRGDGAIEQTKPKTLAEQIRAMEAEFAMAMPKGVEAKQLIRDALTALRQNPDLAKCTPATVLGGLMTFAQLGLRPGVLGHGWLIPFEKRAKVNGRWQSVGHEAQIVIGYKGLIELVHRSGQVSTMVGRAVHENDDFDVEYGLNDNLVHRPAKGDRGPVIAYYAIIKYQSGGYVMWHMSRDEAIEWRNAHAMSAKKNRDTGEVYGSGPWFDEDKGPAGGTGFDQMAIKTCALRAARWAPKATDTAFARAAEVDGTVRFDVDTDPDSMLLAEHPNRDDDVIDGDVVDTAPTAAAPVADVPDPGTVDGDQAVRTDGLVTEFAAVPGKGDDDPATPAQTKAIGSILSREKLAADDQRFPIVSRLVGRPRPVTSFSQLTKPEASRIIELLGTMQDEGNRSEHLAAILAAATAATEQADDGAELPAVSSQAWHDAGHPERSETGKVVTVPTLLNGDCGFCEQDAADGKTS